MLMVVRRISDRIDSDSRAVGAAIALARSAEVARVTEANTLDNGNTEITSYIIQRNIVPDVKYELVARVKAIMVALPGNIGAGYVASLGEEGIRRVTEIKGVEEHDIDYLIDKVVDVESLSGTAYEVNVEVVTRQLTHKI